MAVGTLAQFVFGALGPRLVGDLGISRTQFGALSTAFFVVAALLSPRAGSLTDRFGGRRALLALFAIDLLAFAAMSASPGFPWLLAATAAAGTAIALCNPATNLLIAHHVAPGGRGLVVGIKQSGVFAGSVAAGLILSPLAERLGWRAAFGSAALLALLGVGAALALVPADGPVRARTNPTSTRMRIPALRWLTPYALLMGAGVSSVTAYIALYANEVAAMPEGTAAALVAVLGLVAVPARILWSRGAEGRTTTSGPLLLIALLSVGAIVILMAAEATGGWALWVAAVLAGATMAAWNSVAMLAVVLEAGPTGAGRASGLVLTAFYTGLLAMPVVFGSLVDRTGTYRLGWTLAGLCFVGASFVASRARRGNWPSAVRGEALPAAPPPS